MSNKNNSPEMKLATLDELLSTIMPKFLTPPPKRDALRDMLDRWHVPRLKASPDAKRGGGRVFYSVSHVEKMIQSHTVTP